MTTQIPYPPQSATHPHPHSQHDTPSKHSQHSKYLNNLLIAIMNSRRHTKPVRDYC